MARATKRAMATQTKGAMVTDGDNTGNGYGKEGGRHSKVAMMGTAQRTRPLVLQLEVWYMPMWVKNS